MANIGRLKNVGADPKDQAADLKGTIRTLKWSLDIRIERVGEFLDTQRPSHRIFMRADNKEYIEVGAAWSKTIQRGQNAGEVFLSASIDDPSFDSPLNFQLFEDETGDWSAVWTRPRLPVQAA